MSNLTVASLTGPASQKNAVRMTNPIVFMARPTTDYSGGSMPTGVQAMTVILDPSSSFSAATNAFVAPVAGYYRVTWGGLQLAATVTSLQINGVRQYNGNHYPGGGPGYITMTQTAIVNLAVNNTLQIEGWNGGGYYRDWYLWSVEFIG